MDYSGCLHAGCLSCNARLLKTKDGFDCLFISCNELWGKYSLEVKNVGPAYLKENYDSQNSWRKVQIVNLHTRPKISIAEASILITFCSLGKCRVDYGTSKS